MRTVGQPCLSLWVIYFNGTKKPTLEDMLRAYIIRSRIKEADKIMLAQPYSPQLFRQGLLPGPQLLLDVLLKKMDYAQVKKSVQR